MNHERLLMEDGLLWFTAGHLRGPGQCEGNSPRGFWVSSILYPSVTTLCLMPRFNAAGWYCFPYFQRTRHIITKTSQSHIFREFPLVHRRKYHHLENSPQGEMSPLEATDVSCGQEVGLGWQEISLSALYECSWLNSSLMDSLDKLLWGA